MNTYKRLWGALLLVAGFSSAAQAQQSPSGTWNDSVTFRGTGDRAVDLERARSQQQARRGGFGPGNVTTTYEGEVTFNEQNEYTGPVTSNSATTATNLNSFSNTNKQEGTGHTATVNFTTGNSAWQTSQNATASNANAANGPATNNLDSSN